MKKKQIILFNLITAVIFALLFYKNYVGLNLFIFEIIVLPIMIYVNRPVKFNFLSLTCIGGLLLSSVMVVLLNTSWSIFINILTLMTLSAVLSYQGFRSYAHAFGEGFFRVFFSQIGIFLDFEEKKTPINTTQSTKKRSLEISKIFYFIIIPILVILLFLILYSRASSKFYEQFEGFFRTIYEFIEKIDFLFVIFILFGIIVANVLFMKTRPLGLHSMDLNSNEKLFRVRRKNLIKFKFNGLKTQYISGVILLSALNFLILYFNILDFIYVWFGFKWDGEFLKEFVHEGTWILVLSVFISSGIALIFFRRNLNFYSKNKPLKALTIFWILQNMIMIGSVMIRNYWYIYYFGLAYKRIAVLFFLLLTLIGLITIIIKITNIKSSFYLIKVNGFALFFILMFTTTVNWDVVIAKYNFKHYDRSLINFKFISNLNDATLPYTNKSMLELKEINEVQEKTLPFDLEKHRKFIWDIYTYQVNIKSKRKKFIEKYEASNWLEWNLSDYQTYQKLKNE